MKNLVNKKIIMRPYHYTDAQNLANIYYHTIHKINSKDYSQEEINAWAPSSSLEIHGWKEKWEKMIPMVASIDDTVVGFVEFESNGHIDCFYVHHEYQGCGVGSALRPQALQFVPCPSGL